MVWPTLCGIGYIEDELVKTQRIVSDSLFYLLRDGLDVLTEVYLVGIP